MILLVGGMGMGMAAEASVDAEGVVFFEEKIRPVLVEYCYDCHSAGAKKVKGNLLLDTKAGWERGGDSGEASLVPGDAGASLLIRSLAHAEGADLQMPPKKKLPERVIADFVTWVEMGAPDPRTGVAGEVKRADKSWWSLQPLKAVTEVAGNVVEGSGVIDGLVEKGLREKGLAMNGAAGARELIRRMSYDVTGLPPTMEEVREFESAFAKDEERSVVRLVDRLLASPHYGERWGRHWLDVVRFGESRGFERNLIHDQLWLFRDYVIGSINEDKPFNQFMVEHLAGDVVGKDDPKVEIGTAFLTSGPYDDVGNQDALAQAVIRSDTLDDMVTATGSAFLGLTVNCARCHHHKFDPIPTEDYYRIKSAFEGVQHGTRTLATAEEKRRFEAVTKPLEGRKGELGKEKLALQTAIVERAKLLPKVEATRPVASAQLTEEKFEPVRAGMLRFTVLGTSATVTSGVNGRVDEFEVWSSGKDSRNVALAANGGKVEGAAGRVAEDFDGAYGVQRVNDGKYGVRWIIGSPAVLVVKFAKPELIERVTFSHDRLAGKDEPVPGLGPSVVEYELEVSEDEGKTWKRVADSLDRKALNEEMARARTLRLGSTKEELERLRELDGELAEVQSKLSAVAPLPVAWAGKFSQPDKPTVVFRGGDVSKPGEVVKPSSLAVLDAVTKGYELPVEAKEGERRLALAKWMVDDGNPLTARVLANRVWHYHFGIGLVDTPGDFGFLGSLPTHPELLDWLALRLQHHGWKLKGLHRDILLSRTYRQSAKWDEKASKVDSASRLLWRFPPRRLGAEEVRDTVLLVAGRLDVKMGGPGFRLYDYKNDNVSTYVPREVVGPETYRRAVYHQNARASVVDVLSEFDFPDTAFAAPKRANTTTPMQALVMMNHSFAMDMAKAFAERVKAEFGGDDGGDVEGQIRGAFAVCFQREPRDDEISAARELWQEHGAVALCRALLNTNELIYLE
ncbi:DUF1553 domain-containing protein [Phragmitibacter flavus]|uniref:DUF1553 domain-containing protein n=1 Tax=Phragmitibacter flavus TaxID=2576071 RepID=A0A5R8KD11_9BACT|nr:DUF1553 domain-containing protein [Phragmitibacter flavus]